MVKFIWIVCLEIDHVQILWFLNMEVAHVDGLVQERCNSIANALELHLFCTDPSIFLHGNQGHANLTVNTMATNAMATPGARPSAGIVQT